ncbi:MAG: hypothetical protein OES57_05540 [Acidimicrobiia bacterium]|nr:hypothetical protein [Acidimicrobiia bacterium]
MPTAFVKALCLMALGHHADAQSAFDDALVVAEAADPVAGAQVRAELGRFHLGLGPDRSRSARAHLMAAAVCLRANHVPNLADRVTAMLEGDGPVGTAGPQRGTLRPGDRWLVGFGLSVAVEVDPHPGFDTLRAVLAGGCRSILVDEPARLDVDQALGAVVPALADHVRQSVSFDSSAATYRPAEPIRWALDPRPSVMVPSAS